MKPFSLHTTATVHWCCVIFIVAVIGAFACLKTCALLRPDYDFSSLYLSKTMIITIEVGQIGMSMKQKNGQVKIGKKKGHACLNAAFPLSA